MTCTLTRAMPRPRSLSPDAIAAAALAVIDRDGLDALSMRTVAGQLGMGAMSLYRYVPGRQEIERLAVDLVFRPIDPGVDQTTDWQRQVTELGWRFRAAVAAHPAAIPLLLAHYQSSPSALRWSEAVLAALTQAGFSGPQQVIGLRGLTAYLVGALLNEFFTSLSGAADTARVSLSPAKYPHVTAASRHAYAITPDQEFGQGLLIFTRGLAAGLHIH